MIRQLDNYRIHMDQLLGKGGFGRVVKAVDSRGEKLACKIIPLKSTSHRRIIQRELHLLRRLDDESIVRMVDFVIQERELFIFLEYCNGGDLRSHFQRFRARHPNFEAERRKYEELAMDVFLGLCKAMAYLYSQSVIHRDVKMENILLHNRLIKLGDFGLSRQLEDMDGQIMFSYFGTPSYSSPQLLANQPYNPKTDIWSIGVVLYEIALNALPFEAYNVAQLYQNIRHAYNSGSLVTRLGKIQNPQLRDLIGSMLVFNEEMRMGFREMQLWYTRYLKLTRIGNPAKEAVYLKSTIERDHLLKLQQLQSDQRMQQQQQQQLEHIRKLQGQAAPKRTESWEKAGAILSVILGFALIFWCFHFRRA